MLAFDNFHYLLKYQMYLLLILSAFQIVEFTYKDQFNKKHSKREEINAH